MKLDTAKILIAIDDRDWQTAIKIVSDYFGLDSEIFKDYRIMVEDWPIKNPGRRITIYHKKCGLFCWDQHVGWSADGTWKYGRAGTIAIKVINEN